MPTLSQKTTYWERELLDLSKRNRMLHFRETKRSSLVIESPDFFSLYEKIVRDELSLSFQHPIGRDVDPRVYNLLQLMELSGSPIEVLIGDIHTNQRINDQMLTLRSLRNKAQLAFDEQGTNLLYLSFGFVHWYDGDKRTGAMNSPFLLVPVTFSGSGIHDYSIKLYDDDIVINPTLIYALEQKKHFSFPEFDSEKDFFPNYIKKLIPLLEDSGMALEQRCCLCILSFLKINMYLDLKRNNKRIVSHPVLQEIYTLNTNTKRAEFIHDNEPYETKCQVLSADSSQLDAISLSRQGKSFVLQGPPGTGKSQTITNIIAQALADKKKILFVSEKMAALQVVYRRLEEVGLADFCLPLHDYKADKKQILKQIARPLSLRIKPKDLGADAKLARLEILRKKLNLYPQNMHRIQSAYQMSIYEAIGQLEKLKSIPACNLSIRDSHSLDRLSIMNHQDQLIEFGRTMQAMSIMPHENPWKGYKCEAILPEERQRMLELVDAYLQAVNNARLLVAQAQEAFNLTIQVTPSNLQHMASLLDAILHLPVIPQSWFSLDTNSLIDEVKKEKIQKEEYVKKSELIKSFFSSHPPIDEMIGWLKKYKRIKDELSQYSIDIDSLHESIKAYEITIEQLKRYVNAWEKHVGLFWNADLPIIAAQDYYGFLSQISQVSVFSSQWIQTKTRKQARQVFQSSYQHYDNIQKILAEMNSLGATPVPVEALLEEYKLWKANYSNESLPIINSILWHNWPTNNSPIFASMPAMSTMTWTGQAKKLIDSLGLLANIPYENAEESILDFTYSIEILSNLEKRVGVFTELFPDQNYSLFVQFVQKLSRLQEKLPIPYSWTKQNERKAALIQISNFVLLQNKINEQKSMILKDYQPAVLNLPAEEILYRFEHEYNTLFGKLKPQKKKDIQAVQVLRKSQSSVIHETEMCQLLKALCKLKDLEKNYSELWNKKTYLFPKQQASIIPEDWIAIKDTLTAFDQFCNQDENSYIENLSQTMFDAIPDTVANLHEYDYTKLNAFLTKCFSDLTCLSVQELHRRSLETQHILKKIVELFHKLTWHLNKKIGWRLAYSAMHSLSQEQKILLEHVIELEQRLENEQHLYDSLENQRISLLSPAWSEQNPQWEQVNHTFGVLSQADYKDILSEISDKAPNVTLASLQQQYRYLEDYAPNQMQTLIFETNKNISKSESAKEQLNYLVKIHSKLIYAKELYDDITRYVLPQAKPSQIAEHITYSLELNQLLKEHDAKQEQCILHFGDAYAGWNTDWDRVLKALRRWNFCQIQFPEIKDKLGLFQVIICSQDRSNYEIWVNRAIKTAGTWQDAYAEIENAFERDTLIGLSQYEKEERFSKAADHIEYLDQWSQYCVKKRNIEKCGLGPAITVFENNNIAPELFGQAYEKAFLLAWINQALSNNPEITQFNAQEFDSAIESYRELSQEYLSISRIRLQNALINRVPNQEAGGEMAILRKELTKKAKIMPLRKLFRQIPYLLMKLKPCLMMSPLSVSYFLDSDFYHFDMVIFDEASQIFPQDAIGAILRGDQTIIAGDTKQMPPTDFFSVDLGDDESEEDESEISLPLGDSILEEADYTLISQQLLWHYRSRDEQLIAFSNQHYYDDNLYTFPGNVTEPNDIGVEFVYVPDGVYSKRRNDKEAEMCLRLVREHYRMHPERSLGVVAFNEAQQAAIENLIWNEREKDPTFSNMLSSNKIEPFFIKNLENVQGDERDTIIFSICFGRAPDGKFRYNFGPLGKSGGERRLNVAVTRAKYNVKLVSSIHAEDIDLDRAKSEGARMLKYYIDYATHAKTIVNSRGTDQDFFAESVASFLETQGYEVHRNVGRSAYTVDIAICIKEKPGRYMAAVQCDGSNYVSARTAYDREVIRRTMLENLNWRIVNVWSAYWFAHPSAARKLLINELNKQQTENPRDIDPHASTIRGKCPNHQYKRLSAFNNSCDA